MSDFMFDADTVSVGFDPAIGDSVTICTMGVEEYKRLKKCESLLRSAHEIITQDFPEFTYADWVVKRKSWLASYGKIKAE